MELLNLLLVGVVAAQGYTQPLKVMVHLGFGTLSHIKPLLEIGTVLRERNHTVVYAAFDEAERFNKPYQFKFVSLGSLGQVGDRREQIKNTFRSREPLDAIKSIPNTIGAIGPVVYDATYPAIAKAIDYEKPDVIACDFFSPACRDAAEMKGVPLITGFQSTDMYEIAPSSFITNTLTYDSITTDKLTFIQRIQDRIFIPLKKKYYFSPMTKRMNEARSRYNVPPASHFFGDFSTSLGLANTFEGLEAATPIPPNIKMIGPIKSDFYAPLTPELSKFLEDHPRTMYVAFGSAVVLADFDIDNLVTGSLAALADGSIDGILWGLGKTFAEDFPETFTINGTEITRDHLFSDKHPHMRLLPWAPQTAILEHKSTKLFVSHGGIESTVEAMLSGTPILLMAFFGDQPRNARKLEDAGVGKYVNRLTATPSSVASDIKHVIDDITGSIAANVKRMQAITQIGSRRKALGADAIEEYAYTSQACRPIYPYTYGQVPCELQHLTMASRNMSFIQANAIDVYAIGILALAAILASPLYVWKVAFGTKLSQDPIKKNQ